MERTKPNQYRLWYYGDAARRLVVHAFAQNFCGPEALSGAEQVWLELAAYTAADAVFQAELLLKNHGYDAAQHLYYTGIRKVEPA